MQIPGYVMKHTQANNHQSSNKNARTVAHHYFLCLPIYSNQQIESKLFL
jgi:hypothetical protein